MKMTGKIRSYSRAQRMGTWRGVAIAVLGALVGMVSGSRADVVPGDKIDRTNWQKVDGLVPDPILNYVKKGDFVLNIGKLNYDPVLDPEFLEASRKNAGRYDLDEEGNVVDLKTGKRPKYTYGYPFPDVDPNDPRAAAKIVWNRTFALYSHSQTFFPYEVLWIGRGGLEREIRGASQDYYFDGRVNEVSNPSRTELKELSSVTSPASVEGFLQLTWRYMDNRPDSVWSYVPAMRRTRQLSSVNRSDPFLGSDFTSDDTYQWYGKNQSMDWKLVGQQDVLVQTASADPIPMEAGPMGDGGTSWLTSKDFKGAQIGYDTPNWTGAPWAMTNGIWVRRPAWVIEAFPKDPYYSYGRQVIYADRESNMFFYKVVYSRSGEYWKLVFSDFTAAWSPDGSRRFPTDVMSIAIDERTDHAGMGTAVGTNGHVFEFNSSRAHPTNFEVDQLLRLGK